MFKRNCFAFAQNKNGQGHYYLKCKILQNVESCDGCSSYKTWKQIFDEEEDIIKPRMKELYPWYDYESTIPKNIRRQLEHERKISK